MRSLVLAVLLLVPALPGIAQAAAHRSVSVAARTVARSYADEAFIIENSKITYTYQADGTGVQDMVESIKVQSEAGVDDFSVISLTYAGATQSAKILSASVTHSDGTVTITPPSNAIDQPARVTLEAPLYSDLKVLELPIRGLRPGDTLALHIEIVTTKAEAPGQFWDAFRFLPKAVVLHQTVTLNVPASRYVQVWSPDYKPVITDSDGRKSYTWTYQQLTPTSDIKSNNAGGTSTPKPSLAWTSFHSWQQVGDWYRSLAASRATPTPAIIAEAHTLTQGITNPEQQVRAIYNFVSTHIRYVGVDFGIGRYEPHAAATVLANQYGDCKDKDTLLEALLRASGFTTAPALIGAGIPMIPSLPSPGLFDHVITTVMLPSGQIWLDSTPEVAPFRLLISALRGKQALVIPAHGPAKLERTPAQPPFPFINRFMAVGKITAQGDLTAHVVITDRSDGELLLRSIARNLAPAQWNQSAQYLVRFMGFGGTVTNAVFTNVENLDQPIQLSYDYEHPSFGDWADFRILPLFPSAFLPAAPIKIPSEAIKLGAERTEIAVTRITLPPGFGATLPNAVHVKTSFATFDKTYSFENGVLTATRKIVILQSSLPAASWKDYKKFFSDTSLGELTYIPLTSTNAMSGPEPHPPIAGESDPDAAKLVAEAVRFEVASDWKNALNRLDRAKAIQPKQPFLWSGYGYVAMGQGHRGEAIKDFRHELKLHPDETGVVMFFANYLQKSGEDKDAELVLGASFRRDPSQVPVALVFSLLQSADHNLPEAIATLRKAIAASPQNPSLQATLASFLLNNHQNEEAVAIAKKQLATETDPGILNDDSYLLAETGTDLPLAEQDSRKSLSMLDQQTALTTIGEANAQSFVRSMMLTAGWDTLGYILMKENKLAEARGYLEAAWNNKPSTTIGAHYGELLEKLHQPTAALRIDEIAVTFPYASRAREYPKLKAAIERLTKDGYGSSIGNGQIDLQNDRTFHLYLSKRNKTFSEATFRLLFSSSGLVDLIRVNGDTSMDALIPWIRRLKLPRYVPPQSTAHLLRDAIAACSSGEKECDFVLMPMGGIQAENINH